MSCCDWQFCSAGVPETILAADTEIAAMNEFEAMRRTYGIPEITYFKKLKVNQCFPQKFYVVRKRPPEVYAHAGYIHIHQGKKTFM